MVKKEKVGLFHASTDPTMYPDMFPKIKRTAVVDVEISTGKKAESEMQMEARIAPWRKERSPPCKINIKFVFHPKVQAA